MWIIGAAFVFVLLLAHASIGFRKAGDLHISEMRSLTFFAHVLFLLLVCGSLCFARRARQENRPFSAGVGVGLAVLLSVAWFTPTFTVVHDLFAGAPFLILFVYVPLMLASSGSYFAAGVTLVVPPACDGICLLFFGTSGQLQKVNALLFLALLTFLYYRVLPWRDPF